ncbi:hypothetical protein [Streptomyces albogriseolus]|uniref:hypothetical protein n=1 Tax=Streptomyces albogriseolus TaxID=1887 RepID=UPI003F5402C8
MTLHLASSDRDGKAQFRARPLLERVRVPRTGTGRPRCRPDRVIAVNAYSSRGFRAYLRQRGTAHRAARPEPVAGAGNAYNDEILRTALLHPLNGDSSFASQAISFSGCDREVTSETG